MKKKVKGRELIKKKRESKEEKRNDKKILLKKDGEIKGEINEIKILSCKEKGCLKYGLEWRVTTKKERKGQEKKKEKMF